MVLQQELLLLLLLLLLLQGPRHDEGPGNPGQLGYRLVAGSTSISLRGSKRARSRTMHRRDMGHLFLLRLRWDLRRLLRLQGSEMEHNYVANGIHNHLVK